MGFVSTLIYSHFTNEEMEVEEGVSDLGKVKELASDKGMST